MTLDQERQKTRDTVRRAKAMVTSRLFNLISRVRQGAVSQPQITDILKAAYVGKDPEMVLSNMETTLFKVAVSLVLTLRKVTDLANTAVEDYLPREEWSEYKIDLRKIYDDYVQVGDDLNKFLERFKNSHVQIPEKPSDA